MNSIPATTPDFRGELFEAAKAVLIHEKTNEASISFPTEDGGRVVVEVLYFEAGGKEPAAGLRLLPDPIAASATWV
jgi:hypothetical protein